MIDGSSDAFISGDDGYLLLVKLLFVVCGVCINILKVPISKRKRVTKLS